MHCSPPESDSGKLHSNCSWHGSLQGYLLFIHFNNVLSTEKKHKIFPPGEHHRLLISKHVPVNPYRLFSCNNNNNNCSSRAVWTSLIENESKNQTHFSVSSTYRSTVFPHRLRNLFRTFAKNQVAHVRNVWHGLKLDRGDSRRIICADHRTWPGLGFLLNDCQDEEKPRWKSIRCSLRYLRR